MTIDDPDGPIYRIIERVDGEWTGMITAGVPWMQNQQIPTNKKQRVFYSLSPAVAYRDKLRRRGRDVKLREYRAITTIN